MQCYHPLTVWRLGAQPKDWPRVPWPITFDASKGYPWNELKIPCGKCVGCRIARSRQWAVRCIHEASLHPVNCFITLTYNNDNLPANGSLDKRALQLFWKRLRKAIYPLKIRFFACGEYGEKFKRPHYHAIVFGFDFSHDRVLWSYRHGFKYYRSATLEKAWPFGWCLLTDVSFQSAAYVARYCLKKVTGKRKAEYYGDFQPEYQTQSNRPGIARAWIEQFWRDVYPADRVVVDQSLVLKPPAYYDHVFDLIDPEAFEKIKLQRQSKAVELELSGELSPQRLEVKEWIKQNSVSRLIRPIENGFIVDKPLDQRVISL